MNGLDVILTFLFTTYGTGGVINYLTNQLVKDKLKDLEDEYGISKSFLGCHIKDAKIDDAYISEKNYIPFYGIYSQLKRHQEYNILLKIIETSLKDKEMPYVDSYFVGYFDEKPTTIFFTYDGVSLVITDSTKNFMEFEESERYGVLLYLLYLIGIDKKDTRLIYSNNIDNLYTEDMVDFLNSLEFVPKMERKRIK